MAFKMKGITFRDLTRNEDLEGVSSLKQKKKPDWSKAPKPGTQERTLWYQKHGLALDETTPKVKEFPIYVGEWQEGSYMPDWEGGGSDPIPHSELHKYKGK